ncbi:MAG: glycosyltransferase [Bdellovibrionota bacterium]
MFDLDAQLLALLTEKDSPVLLFAHPENFDRLRNSIPRLTHSFTDKWGEKSFWTAPEVSSLKLDRGVAVCSEPFFELPAASIKALRRAGVEEVVYQQDGAWKEISLTSLAEIMRGRRAAFLASLKHRGVVALRKALLKYRGTDLRTIAAADFAPESGLGFFTHVPSLKEYADAVTGAKQGILFFEEERLLLPHQPHADIREQGQGRCSLWVEHFYFSATDNSDPRSNGRRYRLLKTTPLINRFLFSLPSDAQAVVTRQAARRQRESSSTAATGSTSVLGDLQQFIAAESARSTFASEPAAGAPVAYLVPSASCSRCEAAFLEALDQSSAGYSILREGEIPEAELTIAHLPSKRELRALAILSALPPSIARPAQILFSRLVLDRPTCISACGDRANLVSAVAGILAGVPLIRLTVSGLNPSYTDETHQELLKRWLQVAASASNVEWISDSESAAESYARWLEIPADGFRVLPLAVSAAAIPALTQERVAHFRSELGAQPTSPLVVGAFRLAGEQRPFRFLRLIFTLKQAHADVRAVLVGDGPLREQCRREIENLGLTDVVQLVDAHRRSEAIAAADLVVFTADPEVVPDALIEAMSLGKAIVCTDVGEVRRLIEDGLSGCLSHPREFHSLQARTLDLLQHEEMRSAFGRNAERHLNEKILAGEFAQAFAALPTLKEPVHFEGKRCA